MGLFHKTKPNEPPKALLDTVADIQQRLKSLETDMRDMRTDWNTTYDKFHALTMRMAKRIKREEETPENGPGPTNEPPAISNPLAMNLINRGHLR